MSNLYYELDPVRGLSPVVATDDTVLVTETVDMAGAASVLYTIQLGSLADAGMSCAVVVYEGDASDMSDETAVADEDLVGTEAACAFTQASDNTQKKIEYRGMKRYTRMKITPTGNASDLNIAVSAHRKMSRKNV